MNEDRFASPMPIL